MTYIYARQSVDKKDSISIETQIDICRREAAPGEECTVMQDKGFSGKNTDRPGFKRLMRDVDNGEVDKLVVYRLDRISRSITDFAGIMDVLEERKVGFVSASEKFDTTTPVGRAMLYIIMVFAQLERETIAERIRDNYYARGKDGVWLGGPAPFGFDLVRVDRGGKRVPALMPNDDIRVVCDIYAEYANTGASLGAIAKRLQSERGEMWSNVKLARILHNPAYVRANADVYHYYQGKRCIIINPIDEFDGVHGCSLYGKRDRGAAKYNAVTDHVLALALHGGVIDADQWLKCQRKLDSNRQIKNSGKGRHSWLSGIAKCGYCGYGLVVRTYGSQLYFYCSGRALTDKCADKLATHYVRELEDCVWREMSGYVRDVPDRVSTGASNAKDVNDAKIELHKVDEQIGNLMDSLASVGASVIPYVNSKIEDLDKRRRELLAVINEQADESDAELPDISDWHNLTNDARRTLAFCYLRKVSVFNDRLEIDWKH